MSDLSRHSRHEHLDEIKHIVAIGGGHGLGRVLSALSFMKERLTGIVTTTDNGGSTGRIRQEQGGIAWGDLRNCLNQIIIEPSTAVVVRRIFLDVIAGKSCTQIAKELNAENIPTPAQQKSVVRKTFQSKAQWTHWKVLKLIANIKYTGTMVNHTRESRFIRDKSQCRLPPEEWVIRENAHEAIVTRDEYQQAQEVIPHRKKSVRVSHDQSDRVYFCAHCGGKLEKANGTASARTSGKL